MLGPSYRHWSRAIGQIVTESSVKVSNVANMSHFPYMFRIRSDKSPYLCHFLGNVPQVVQKTMQFYNFRPKLSLDGDALLWDEIRIWDSFEVLL